MKKTIKDVMKKEGKNPAEWPKRIICVYIMLMLGAFPFCYHNKYFDMGEVKYLFFRTATIGMLAFVLLTVAGSRLVVPEKGRARLKMSAMDWVVLAYAGTAFLSWVLSPFRLHAWIGSDGWYMGFLSQILFVGIYFCLSRFGTEQKWPLWVMGISSAAVFMIAYLHRFNIDPLGLYEGVPDRYKLTFVGILGQATWYSSYICVVLPAMMGIYIAARWDKPVSGSREHILAGIFIFLGFCTAVTQNSDSVYIGLGLAFIYLLWFAIEDIRVWKRYMEVGLLTVSAAKFTGVLQTIFPEHVPRLDKLSFLVTKGRGGWMALVFGMAVYGITCFAEKRYKKIHWEKFASRIRKARLGFYILLFLAAAVLFVMMWLATTGRISSGALPWLQTRKNSYLVYNEDWGNGRGKAWNYCIRVFREYPPVMKLFGCGPDSFVFYSAVHHAEEIRAMWGNASLNNAHNEWLTALIDYGIIGAAAYISVFAMAFVRSARNSRYQPFLLATGAAVLSYAGHNCFCYQQSICTPLIFIVMGTSEYLIRTSSQ